MSHGSRQQVEGRRLVLASGSPRRRELLKAEGFEFEVVSAGVDDGLLRRGDAGPAEWATALAYLKAAAGLAAVLAEDGTAAVTVIGADTICVLEDRIIGQPRDADDAREILYSFSARDHEVVTGVALIDAPTGEREMWAESANVNVGELTPELVEPYVASGAWRGKAGAYNLAERLAAGWPIRYEGDPMTIMGLPMARLRGRLGVGAGPSDGPGPCSCESTETAA